MQFDKLSSLIDSLPGIVFSAANDPEWSMKYLSQGCLTLTGYPSEELVEVSYRSILHAEDLPKVLNGIATAIAQKQPYEVEYRIRTQSGQEKWVWEKGSGVFDLGEVLGLTGFIADISKRKQAEVALWQSQQMLQLVMDNIPQSIFWKDRNSVYLGCNRNFAQVAGVGSPENIVGKTDYDLPWKQEEATFFRKYDRQVIKTDTPKHHNY